MIPFDEQELDEVDGGAWLMWLFDAEQAVCDHEEWVDESWASPDSGGDGGHCPRCGFCFNVTFY